MNTIEQQENTLLHFLFFCMSKKEIDQIKEGLSNASQTERVKVLRQVYSEL